jgi:hypothetical protein
MKMQREIARYKILTELAIKHAFEALDQDLTI